MKLKLHEQILIGVLIVLFYMRVSEIGSKPPTPDPDDPQPKTAWRALIEEETSGDYTPAQAAALASARNGDIRDALDKEYGPGAHHVWDKDLDVSAQDKFWQDAMKRPTKTLPEVKVYNGRRWIREQSFKDSAELKKALGVK